MPDSVSIVTQPSHGTAVVNATTGAITYTARFHIQRVRTTLTYRVADDSGESLSNVATLSIQVTGGVSPAAAACRRHPRAAAAVVARWGWKFWRSMLLAFLKAASSWTQCRTARG